MTKIRELVAGWRGNATASRALLMGHGPACETLAKIEAGVLEHCALDLEAALAEQGDEIERLKAALDDAERGARSALETELWAIIDRDGFAGIVPSDIHDAVSRLVKMAEQDVGWVPAREASIRDLAVAIVDLSCGYTMEFAPSPAQHRSTYDFVEEKIRAEIKDALAEQDGGDSKALGRALAGLVNLKRYKDKHGKDATYMRLQPGAWREAEDALKRHLLPRPPISDDPHVSASEEQIS